MTRELRPTGNNGRRFIAPKVGDSTMVRSLNEDSPAIRDRRTIFPSRVFMVDEVPRLLVSGANNSKIGAKVLKGPWAGMPIFTLTLEERATCPSSCHEWLTCYGAGLPFSRRVNAADPAFMDALIVELIQKQQAHPKGYVVRLHILGDFYSRRYVKLWAAAIDKLPALRVWGYTARREDQDDDESRAIARDLRILRDKHFDRFAMRTSHTEVGPDRTIVVEAPVDGAGIVACPAEIHETVTCGSCAICFSAAARGKTIAFKRHGPKHGPRGPKLSAAKASERLASVDDAERARIAASYGAKFRT